MKKLITSLCILTTGFFFAGEKSANAQDTTVFNYQTDTIQYWTVPCNTDSLIIELWGAGGGSGYQNFYNDAWCGGSGAYMIGVLSGASLAGQTLSLYVPHGGRFSNAGYGGNGGWPGGGNGGNDSNFSEWGGGGGGYAAIAIGTNYFVVVGGGGGGGSTGYGGSAYGGGGGATAGGNGVTTFGTAGTGGTLSSGGIGGTGYSLSGNNGAFLTGGVGQAILPNGDSGGGGGGAGYYGGGGGGDEGNSGGGGSTFPASSITISGVTFNPSSNLQGTMNSGTTGSAVAPGPHTGNVGNGTIDSNGGNGQIIIITRLKYLQVMCKVLGNDSCDGASDGSAYAIASGGNKPYTYLWTGGQTTDTATAFKAGTYTITVTDSTGCTASASVVITQPPTLKDTAHQFGHIACFGDNTGTAAASAIGGTKPYRYLWLPSGGTKDSATGLTGGTYTVIVTDPCHDTARTTVTLTQPNALVATATQVGNILCHGGSQGQAAAVVTGGTGMYTYMWTSGASKDTATGLKAITYTVNVTDSNGCKAAAFVTITQPAVIKLVAKQKPDSGGCHGLGWLVVTGGTAPYNFLWSDGNTGDTITECYGTYCCTVTDANGCMNYDCVTITSTTGIQDLSNANSINVYPDPNNGDFNISGVQPGEVIELYNYMGQKLSSTIANNNGIMHFNIGAQANGIYMLRILSNSGNLITQKRLMKVQ